MFSRNCSTCCSMINQSFIGRETLEILCPFFYKEKGRLGDEKGSFAANQDGVTHVSLRRTEEQAVGRAKAIKFRPSGALQSDSSPAPGRWSSQDLDARIT